MGFDLNFQLLAVQFPPFILAVVFHEYAHGWVANLWGDPTAKDEGRLTFNPIPHMDFMGTFVFPVIIMLSGLGILFGWAKPVPITPSRFHKYRPGLFWVSFAGPGMNFLLSFVSAIVVCLFIKFLPQGNFLYEPLVRMATVSVILNLWLGFFNLLPLPPLDGAKILDSFLPYDLSQKFAQLGRYSFFILIILLMSGAFRYLAYPIQLISSLLLLFWSSVFGVDLQGLS